MHIREATAADAPVISRFLRCMLEEMASLGGHAVSGEAQVWAEMEARIRQQLASPEHLYLLAEAPAEPGTPIGLAEARAGELAPLFVARRVLHIHSLYVVPAQRRKGVGRALLEALLEWGRSLGCVEAELDTLVANPARHLYEKAGFRASEIEMRRRL